LACYHFYTTELILWNRSFSLPQRTALYCKLLLLLLLAATPMSDRFGSLAKERDIYAACVLNAETTNTSAGSTGRETEKRGAVNARAISSSISFISGAMTRH